MLNLSRLFSSLQCRGFSWVSTEYSGLSMWRLLLLKTSQLALAWTKWICSIKCAYNAASKMIFPLNGQFAKGKRGPHWHTRFFTYNNMGDKLFLHSDAKFQRWFKICNFTCEITKCHGNVWYKISWYNTQVKKLWLYSRLNLSPMILKG